MFYKLLPWNCPGSFTGFLKLTSIASSFLLFSPWVTSAIYKPCYICFQVTGIKYIFCFAIFHPLLISSVDKIILIKHIHMFQIILYLIKICLTMTISHLNNPIPIQAYIPLLSAKIPSNACPSLAVLKSLVFVRSSSSNNQLFPIDDMKQSMALFSCIVSSNIAFVSRTDEEIYG